MLRNTVISEPVSVCSSKQGQEVSNTNYHSLKYSSPVKAQVQERPIETSSSPSDVVNTEDRPSSDKSTDPVAPAFNDTDAIEVQSVIRGYLVYCLPGSESLLHRLVCVYFLPLNIFRPGKSSTNLGALSSCKLLYVDIW